MTNLSFHHFPVIFAEGQYALAVGWVVAGDEVEGLLQLRIIDICHGDAVRVELLYDTEDTAAERAA